MKNSTFILSLMIAGAISFTTSVVFADEVPNYEIPTEPGPAVDASYKFIKAYDFDFLEEEQKLGGLEDKGIGNSDKKFIDVSPKAGIQFDFDITSKGAYSGKALRFTAIDGAGGVYVPFKLNLTQNKPANQKYVGAEEFWFYVDVTGWKEDRGVRPVIYENGCDISGEPIGEQTAWVPDHTKPIYVEDGKGGWLKAISESGGTIELKSDYKGFVRIPISSFNYAGYDGKPWGNVDTNGKFDGAQIMNIALEVGCFERNNGNYIIFDQIGFLGNYSVGTKIPKLQGQTESISDAKAQSTSETRSDVESKPEENILKPFELSPEIIVIIIASVVVICAIIAILIILKKGKQYDEIPTDKQEKGKKN